MNLFITRRIISDITGKKDYLTRWSLWLPFGLSIKIHKIVKPDDDRCEHDHPWWFVRVILFGGYKEKVNGRIYERKPWRPWYFWRIYPCMPSFKHRITHLPKKVNWSLVICGKNRGKWGFYTKRGWIHWKRFISLVNSSRVLWCDDRRKV